MRRQRCRVRSKVIYCTSRLILYCPCSPALTGGQDTQADQFVTRKQGTVRLRSVEASLCGCQWDCSGIKSVASTACATEAVPRWIGPCLMHQLSPGTLSPSPARPSLHARTVPLDTRCCQGDRGPRATISRCSTPSSRCVRISNAFSSEPTGLIQTAAPASTQQEEIPCTRRQTTACATSFQQRKCTARQQLAKHELRRLPEAGGGPSKQKIQPVQPQSCERSS